MCFYPTLKISNLSYFVLSYIILILPPVLIKPCAAMRYILAIRFLFLYILVILFYSFHNLLICYIILQCPLVTGKCFLLAFFSRIALPYQFKSIPQRFIIVR